ncbi:hypothetical protein DY000_02054419 [Brassica cretica]|uniref:Uncharacterized protein n=1 Tax=Brassica cretica TaxID=69181 RepID=A0ABQ7AEI7_BRACR|nr:hypothetical protein DY000_02054419 [Brassica cretica]
MVVRYEAHVVKVGEDRAVRETNGQRVIRNAIDRFAFGSKEILEAVEFSGLRRVSYRGERLEEMKPCMFLASQKWTIEKPNSQSAGPGEMSRRLGLSGGLNRFHGHRLFFSSRGFWMLPNRGFEKDDYIREEKVGDGTTSSVNYRPQNSYKPDHKFAGLMQRWPSRHEVTQLTITGEWDNA